MSIEYNATDTAADIASRAANAEFNARQSRMKAAREAVAAGMSLLDAANLYLKGKS